MIDIRPSEWTENKIFYLAYPFREDLWGDILLSVQKEWVDLVNAITSNEAKLIFPSQDEHKKAIKKWPSLANFQFEIFSFADIWVRDTLPIFMKKSCVIPSFNGWGGKYLFDEEKDLAQKFIKDKNILAKNSELIFEGGALEFDGFGNVITTRSCLLNSNRKNGIHNSEAHIEKELKSLFNVKNVIWLNDGLKGDHTDGHVDNIARFIGKDKIAVMDTSDKDDPNYEVLKDIQRDLKGFDVVKLPSPNKILSKNGHLMPASYLNFIFTKNYIIMPTFDCEFDALAQQELADNTNKKVIGLCSKNILEGGGSFHCISQEYFL